MFFAFSIKPWLTVTSWWHSAWNKFFLQLLNVELNYCHRWLTGVLITFPRTNFTACSLTFFLNSPKLPLSQLWIFLLIGFIACGWQFRSDRIALSLSPEAGTGIHLFIKDGLLVISKSSVFYFLVWKFTTFSMLELSIRLINLSFSCVGLLIDLTLQSIFGKLKSPLIQIGFFPCMLVSRFISSKCSSLLVFLGDL